MNESGGTMPTIVTTKDLINESNKEDWHHFTVTPRSKEQAEELRDAFEKVVKNQGEKVTQEDRSLYEFFMGYQKRD